jgi:hypothetical protein
MSAACWSAETRFKRIPFGSRPAEKSPYPTPPLQHETSSRLPLKTAHGRGSLKSNMSLFLLLFCRCLGAVKIRTIC